MKQATVSLGLGSTMAKAITPLPLLVAEGPVCLFPVMTVFWPSLRNYLLLAQFLGLKRLPESQGTATGMFPGPACLAQLPLDATALVLSKQVPPLRPTEALETHV